MGHSAGEEGWLQESQPLWTEREQSPTAPRAYMLCGRVSVVKTRLIKTVSLSFELPAIVSFQFHCGGVQKTAKRKRVQTETDCAVYCVCSQVRSPRRCRDWNWQKTLWFTWLQTRGLTWRRSLPVGRSTEDGTEYIKVQCEEKRICTHNSMCFKVYNKSSPS